MNTITIPSRNGGRNYQVLLGVGFFLHPQEFRVVARSAVMALDIVGDYCEKHGLRNLCATKEELAPLCPKGQTVDEFAEMHGLTKCGINGVYVIANQINEL
jgi:hypothetical protein